MSTPTRTNDATRQLESIWLVLNTTKTKGCLVVSTSAGDAEDKATLLGMDSIQHAVLAARLNTIIHRPALGHSDPGGSTTESL